MKKTKYQKSNYIPTNPGKYVGKYPIKARSSWEKIVCRYLDMNEFILAWSSEPFPVPYRWPDGSIHRYFPDFYVKYKKADGTVAEQVWEIKPYKETHKPRKSRTKKQTTKIYENKMYVKNQLKWQAAEKLCKNRGLEFKIITERQIFSSKKKYKR